MTDKWQMEDGTLIILDKRQQMSDRGIGDRTLDVAFGRGTLTYRCDICKEEIVKKEGRAYAPDIIWGDHRKNPNCKALLRRVCFVSTFQSFHDNVEALLKMGYYVDCNHMESGGFHVEISDKNSDCSVTGYSEYGLELASHMAFTLYEDEYFEHFQEDHPATSDERIA